MSVQPSSIRHVGITAASAYVAGVAAAVFLLWAGLDPLADRQPGGRVPLLLTGVAVAAAAVLLYAGIASFTELAGVLVGTVEPAVTTSRVELTACLVTPGRVEEDAREVDKAREQPQVPAVVAEHVAKVEVQVGRREPADRVRLGLDGDGAADRHAKIELRAAAGALPQVHLQRRAELERRFQVRHADARVVVATADRRGRADADAELDLRLLD